MTSFYATLLLVNIQSLHQYNLIFDVGLRIMTLCNIIFNEKKIMQKLNLLTTQTMQMYVALGTQNASSSNKLNLQMMNATHVVYMNYELTSKTAITDLVIDIHRESNLPTLSDSNSFLYAVALSQVDSETKVEICGLQLIQHNFRYVSYDNYTYHSTMIASFLIIVQIKWLFNI